MTTKLSELSKTEQALLKSLAAKMGTTPEALAASAKGTVKKPKVVKKAPVVVKEYVIATRRKCTTCHTTTTQFFKMQQRIDTNALISAPITEQQALKSKLDHVIEDMDVKSCDQCHLNLSLLSSDDLATMYLELLNNRGKK